jgi:hypothetical protein
MINAGSFLCAHGGSSGLVSGRTNAWKRIKGALTGEP